MVGTVTHEPVSGNGKDPLIKLCRGTELCDMAFIYGMSVCACLASRCHDSKGSVLPLSSRYLASWRNMHINWQAAVASPGKEDHFLVRLLSLGRHLFSLLKEEDK